ncbi:MAG: TonB-dependent receptor, partial [Flavobacteriales bacterium]|nr:TonB-dependent receptor [Flavobacteriales bacterium]
VDQLYDFDSTGSSNPDVAAYTQSYYDLYTDPTDHYENRNQVQDGGGLINGFLPGELTSDVYDLWRSPGRVSNGYSVRNNSQFRMLASGSADILKNHEVSAGFEYEQRTDRFFSAGDRAGIAAIWRQMRLKTNSHILELDKNNPQEQLIYDPFNGTYIPNGFIDYPRRYVGSAQSLFDYNLRQELGLATNGLDWIDLNSYGPETFSLDMFSPDELLDNGNTYVSYYGYDHTGKRLNSKPTLDDFFTQVSTVDGYKGPQIFDRPIGAYEPNYVAGYIQDKFAFKDLVFNIGLRIDRFDANQKVLKDPYLLFPAITAGEVRSGDDRSNIGADGTIPSSILDDYVVYVDNEQNPSAILGFRNGDTWYNAEGSEIPTAKALQTSSGVIPYLVDPDKTNANQISSNAFQDYAPQTNFMPRIAFSFPISEEALFFAHYDVLTRRPSTGTNPIERFSPTHYLFMQNRNIVLNNPNLKPSKTIDYELGFQQKLTSYSSLKIAAFYREMRDQVQVKRVTDAYPITYLTYGNLDFGTVKGMTFAYDLRRMGNIRVRASYTLAFAEGTGSSSSTALAVVSAGLPNLKTINSLNWDQRHQIQLTFDYHYGKGKDYNGPVWFNKKVFEEAGANFVLIGGSGVPYSKQRDITKAAKLPPAPSSILDGTLNGSRLPWQMRIDGKIDKYFDLEWGKEDKKRAQLNVYLQLLNVLNIISIADVYKSTGNPNDDGYLTDPGTQAGIASENDEQAFRDLYTIKVNDPDNYSVPRRIRLGLLLNF